MHSKPRMTANHNLEEATLISFDRYIVSGIYCLLKLRFEAPGTDTGEREVQLSLTMEQCEQLSKNLSAAAIVLELERPTAAQ